jgi:glycosyltransferase involved in cell wall biosynthesis
VLLRGYFEEFSTDEPVCLFIHTYLYGQKNSRNREDIEERVLDFTRNHLGITDRTSLPCFNILIDEYPAREMPKLYKNFDAFVLPTRGEGEEEEGRGSELKVDLFFFFFSLFEGWGLPIVEAMSMG